MNERPAFVAPANPQLMLASTLIICLGSAITALTLPDADLEINTYRYGAYAMALTLALAFGIEVFGGVRSLIRVDIVAMATLFFLTFAEFLAPNVTMLYGASTGNAAQACEMVSAGLACIAIGRHIEFRPRARRGGVQPVSLPEISPRAILITFFLFTFLGYLYVLLVTKFNIVDIIQQSLGPRFTQAWQRGAIGDWRSFLTELDLLLYLVAALGGYIFANLDRFKPVAMFSAAAVLLFMLFFDIAAGARNVVIIKVGLFLVTLLISRRRGLNLSLIAVCFLSIAFIWEVSGFMLMVRNQGLGNYVAENGTTIKTQKFMIDNNLVTIARIVSVYPDNYPYPGMDVLSQVLTKWVPRALWPSKPTEWTNSVEDVLGTGGGYTLALSYVGEAYLIAGWPSLIIVSLLLGIGAGAWNRIGQEARTNLDLIYYASGFFAAALGMRSIQFITIAMVPTVALYVFGRILIRRRRAPEYAT
jgi:hypothetical protein